jgi:hypothetical protein
MTTKNGKGPLTSEELQELRPLTAGDFYWGHKHADKLPDGTDDGTDLMVHTVHHAAVRAGIGDEKDIYGFLDRIELTSLTSVFGAELTEETQGPLAEPTGTSQPSATSGG